MDLDFQRLSIMFVPFVMAVVFHEYAHGWVANRWGDQTAKAAGRLTLNPIPHIDPIGTLVFPLLMMLGGVNILFGWAKPVPINPSRFHKYRPGLFWVALAGPGMNFILAVISALCFAGLVRFMPRDFYLFEPLAAMTQVSVFLNIALGIFNLIPLPPLDGSKIVQSFISHAAAEKYERLAQYSFYILLALIFTGAFRVLMFPIRFCSELILGIAALLFGLR